jgi:integrase
LFELASSSGYYPKGENPAQGHKVFTKKQLQKVESITGYLPFTTDELIQIFAKKDIMGWRRPYEVRPADLWLPLLGLFTGGRIEELSQLAITDIQQVEGIWVISINDEEYKSIKSEAARRNVPIHPQLLKLNFLDYVEDAKQFGTMLFPYLIPNTYGRFSDNTSERFGKYLDKIGISDPKKVFHSFRKTSNNTLKNNKVSVEERCEFVGHEYEQINSQVYSKQFSVTYLAENVASKLIFDGVDFEPLTYQRGFFLNALEYMCRAKKHHEITKAREAELKAREEAEGRLNSKSKAPKK